SSWSGLRCPDRRRRSVAAPPARRGPPRRRRARQPPQRRKVGAERPIRGILIVEAPPPLRFPASAVIESLKSLEPSCVPTNAEQIRSGRFPSVAPLLLGAVP